MSGRKGIKRARKGDLAETNVYARRHAADRFAERDPTYEIAESPAGAVLVLDNERRTGSDPFRFSISMSAIPNVGRVRVKKIMMDHMWSTINSHNNTINMAGVFGAGSTAYTASATITTGYYTGAALATEIQTQCDAALLAAATGPITCTCTYNAPALPTSRGSFTFAMVTFHANDTIQFQNCSFFTYGNPVHGLSERIINTGSASGWGPPAQILITGALALVVTGIAGLVPSRYYVIKSDNLTNASKLQSYGGSNNALAIFFNLTAEQRSSDQRDNFSMEEVDYIEPHSVSVSQTRQIGGSVDIEIVDEYGLAPEAVIPNPAFVMLLTITKHY